MSVAALAQHRPMTIEEFLALPEDGIERHLIRGVLVEQPMTRRNRHHSKAEARLAHFLTQWLLRQPAPRGEVYSGEAGFLLHRNPDTGVGIDVAYVSAETVAAQIDDETSMIDGIPVLAVEVLSPNDTTREINQKIDEYLAVGVSLVWVVDPHFKTVRVHRPNANPDFFTVDDELTGEPDLPGLRIPMREIFE